jgi:hypothetical protein
MTALRIARGITEKMGEESFAVIDTESRSASKYSDRIPFDVDDLVEKNIESYIKSMSECVNAGYKVLVIDSLSHAWQELLDEVDRITKSNTYKGNSWRAWSEGTPKQRKLVDAILNFPGHIIVTMRSKTEWATKENEKGKTVPIKLGLQPEQGKGIEYEFDLLLEMDQDHNALVSKDRTGKFQDENISKPDEEFGVKLYDWLNSGSALPPAPVQPPPPVAGNAAPNPIAEKRKATISEITEIISKKRADETVYFTDTDKAEAKKVIIETPRTDAGNQALKIFAEYLISRIFEMDAETAQSA